MLKAVDRVTRACARREIIGVFGDYDCDGITGVCQIIRALKRRGIEPVVRLPHRLNEGYGLSRMHVEEFASKGVTLLLTVDTGITAGEPVVLAFERGIDVIILDHHRPPAELPSAYAILHPALHPAFPSPHPAAAGVSLSFVAALEGGVPWEDCETDLALAAIGTVADVVPLLGFNRALVERGLRAMPILPPGGLQALVLSVARPGVALTSRDIAFRIAPRINAAGRIANPLTALHALLGDAASLEQLHTLNVERQLLTKNLVDPLLSELSHADTTFLCICSEAFPAGVMGLIAGRLTEATGRPSLVGCIEGELCRASLRGIPDYDVLDALASCSGLFVSFGGHAQAAGCTFSIAQLPLIQKHLSAHLQSRVPASLLSPTFDVEQPLTPEALTLTHVSMLAALEPFGYGNPEPRFLVRAALFARPRRVGRDSAHLQAEICGTPGIGFGLGHLVDHLRRPLDVAVRIMRDTWNGREYVKFLIEDIAVSTVKHAVDLGVAQTRD